MAQALAGGNNTVIVATTGIIGSMLAPDPGAGDACRSASWSPACGSARCRSACWPRPMAGASRCRSARCSARCPASSRARRCCTARSGCCWSAPCAAASTRRRISPIALPPTDTASPQFRPKAVAWVLAGGVFAAVHRPAARHLHQGHLADLSVRRRRSWRSRLCAVLAAGVLTLLKIPRPPVSHSFSGRAAAREIVAQPHFIVAVVCGLASYTDDEHGDDLGAARHGHVQSHASTTRRSASSGTSSACMRRASSPAR